MNSLQIKTISVLHIFSAVLTVASIFSIYYYFDSRGHAGVYPMAITTLAAIFGWISLYFLKKSIRDRIQNIVQESICENFSPDIGLSFTDIRQGKYIGLDSKNGTMLLISLGEKNKSKTFGVDFNDWSGYELDDCNLTLKFKSISRPTYNMDSNAKIKNFCSKLDVLLSPSYKPEANTGNSFSQFVQQKHFA